MDLFLERRAARIARSRESYRLTRELRDQATTAMNESEIRMKTAVCFEVTVLLMSTFPHGSFLPLPRVNTLGTGKLCVFSEELNAFNVQFKSTFGVW